MAIHACAATGDVLVLPAGPTCITLPLTLKSGLHFRVPTGAVLKAGPSAGWPNASDADAVPMLSCDGCVNVSISGNGAVHRVVYSHGSHLQYVGTIDGSGEQWWTGSNKVQWRIPTPVEDFNSRHRLHVDL